MRLLGLDVVCVTLDQQVESLYRDGYIYLPDVLSSEQVAQLRERMENLVVIPESFDKHTDPAAHGYMNKSINNAFNRHPQG